MEKLIKVLECNNAVLRMVSPWIKLQSDSLYQAVETQIVLNETMMLMEENKNDSA
jgi:hypothetical protein